MRSGIKRSNAGVTLFGEPMYFLIWNHWYASLPRRRSFRASTLAAPHPCPPVPPPPHPNGKRNAWRSLTNIWVEGHWYARLSRKYNEQFTRKNSTMIGIQNGPDQWLIPDKKKPTTRGPGLTWCAQKSLRQNYATLAYFLTRAHYGSFFLPDSILIRELKQRPF